LEFEITIIRYIEFGDIFKIEGVNSYAHGCNCSGVMGKGIAVNFKEKFPKMYTEYRRLCIEKKFNLGEVYVYNYGKGFVFNLATQISWRTKAELKAIEQCLETMLSFASSNNIQKIALPKIGAGLGGLDWEYVKMVIEKTSQKYSETELFIVENYKK